MDKKQGGINVNGVIRPIEVVTIDTSPWQSPSGYVGIENSIYNKISGVQSYAISDIQSVVMRGTRESVALRS